MFASSKKFTMNYEELIGLLSTLGVLGSLLLSMQVALLTTLSMDDLTLGNYRNLLYGQTAFRPYAVALLEEQGFNFKINMSSDVQIDLKEMLLSLEKPSHLEEQPPFDEYQRIIDVFFHSTRNDIPLHKTTAWTSYHAKGVILMSTSATFFICQTAGVAIILFTIAICTSVFTYISLVLSDASEKKDSNPEVLKAFTQWALPIALFFGYIPFTAGVMLFYSSVIQYLKLRSLFIPESTIWWILLLFCLFPIILLLGAVNYMVFRRTQRVSAEEVRKFDALNKNDEAQPDEHVVEMRRNTNNLIDERHHSNGFGG